MVGPGEALTSLILGAMPANASPGHFLASGPWCFCGQEESFPDWETGFTFAPEPLADPDLLPVAARAAQTLCIRLVPAAAALLAPEPEQLPLIYWQLLLAPWLIDLASQIVDRALRCAAMRQAFGQRNLMVPLLPPDCEFNFRDEHDFTLRGSLGLTFNHWLFSRLLESAWPAAWEAAPQPAPQRHPAQATPHKTSLSRKLHSLAHRLSLSLAFPKLKGMSASQALRFSWALRHPCSGPDHSLDLQKTFNFEADLARIFLPSDLTPILRAAMPESLKKLRHAPVKNSERKPRLRIAALAAHEDAVYRQKLAMFRAQGGRLAHIQHGGVYGLVETPCAAAITEYSQDIFFTWGWKKHGDASGNFAPMPSLPLSGRKARRPGKKLIFVGAEMPVYGRRLDSHPTPLQYVAYREAKSKFFEAIGEEILASSLYRPYFKLPGTLADAEWLLPRFPALGLCEGDLGSQIRNCRLLVLDHHGTTMLEAFAWDVPMVLYWNRDYWPLTEEGRSLLDMLMQAGIWQPTPEAAAAQARGIWDDPESWWAKPEIRLARQTFCAAQAWTSTSITHDWLRKLGTL